MLPKVLQPAEADKGVSLTPPSHQPQTCRQLLSPGWVSTSFMHQRRKQPTGRLDLSRCDTTEEPALKTKGTQTLSLVCTDVHLFGTLPPKQQGAVP